MTLVEVFSFAGSKRFRTDYFFTRNFWQKKKVLPADSTGQTERPPKKTQKKHQNKCVFLCFFVVFGPFFCPPREKNTYVFLFFRPKKQKNTYVFLIFRPKKTKNTYVFFSGGVDPECVFFVFFCVFFWVGASQNVSSNGPRCTCPIRAAGGEKLAITSSAYHDKNTTKHWQDFLIGA